MLKYANKSKINCVILKLFSIYFRFAFVCFSIYRGMSLNLSLVFICLLAHQVSARYIYDFAITNASDVETEWLRFHNTTLDWSHKFVNWIEPTVIDILDQSSISNKCSDGIKRVIKAFGKLELSAVKMLDSWGRFPPSGMLQGTYTSFGSYDECLEINFDNSKTQTQYCTLLFSNSLPPRVAYHNVLHPVTIFRNATKKGLDNDLALYLASKAHFMYYMPLRLGVCLPTDCSTKEVEQIAQVAGNKLALKAKVKHCEDKEALKPPHSSYQIISIMVLALAISLVVIGTCIDCFDLCNYSPTPAFRPFLLAFSMGRNIKSLVNTETSDGDISCLHGMRVLLISWIIMGHVFLWINYSQFSRSFQVSELVTPFWVQGFLHVNIGVDAFFFISGLLTIYATWKMTGGNLKKLNLFGYFTARLLRLTPAYIIFIAGTFMLPYFGSGPLWRDVIGYEIHNCELTWWSNLIYLHNIFGIENICMIHTWYLSIDMQFHFAAIVVIFLLMKKPLLGHIANSTLILLFTAICACLTYFRAYPPFSITTMPEVEQRYNWGLYYKLQIWPHVGPYCVGLAFGYILAKNKKSLKIHLSKLQVFLAWAATALTSFTISFLAIYRWNNGDPYNPTESAIYAATHRTLWAVCLGWVVLACCLGRGGFIEKFLTWKAFVPLSRITYSVYLVHGWFIVGYIGYLRQLFDANLYNFAMIFFSHLMASFLCGWIFALLFESPFLVIQKEILKRRSQFTNVASDDKNCENNNVDLMPKTGANLVSFNQVP